MGSPGPPIASPSLGTRDPPPSLGIRANSAGASFRNVRSAARNRTIFSPDRNPNRTWGRTEESVVEDPSPVPESAK